MRTPTTVLAILLTLAAAAPRLHAQSTHVASQAALDAAIQQHLDDTTAQRDAVLRVLARGEVKAVAGRVGMDLTTAATAVASLSGGRSQGCGFTGSAGRAGAGWGRIDHRDIHDHDHHRAPGHYFACRRY
jgi:hypothetical protein